MKKNRVTRISRFKMTILIFFSSESNGFYYFFALFQGHALIQLCQTVPDVKIFGVASKSKHEALQDKGITHLLERGSDYVSEVRKWVKFCESYPQIRQILDILSFLILIFSLFWRVKFMTFDTNSHIFHV